MTPDKWIEVALNALSDHPGWLSFTIIALFAIYRYKDIVSAHTERSAALSKTAETIRQKQIRFDEGVEARRRKQLPHSRGPRTDK